MERSRLRHELISKTQTVQFTRSKQPIYKEDKYLSRMLMVRSREIKSDLKNSVKLSVRYYKQNPLRLSNTKSMANFLKSFKDQNKSSSKILLNHFSYVNLMQI